MKMACSKCIVDKIFATGEVAKTLAGRGFRALNTGF
jgi:hypothetical protein